MRKIDYILILISWIACVSFGIWVGGDSREVIPADPLVLCEQYEPCPINFQVVERERAALQALVDDLKGYKQVAENCKRAFEEVIKELEAKKLL